MNAKKQREKRGLSLRQAAAILKEHYPQMDAPLLCKAENPEQSGIRLTAAAERVLARYKPNPRISINRAK